MLLWAKLMYKSLRELIATLDEKSDAIKPSCVNGRFISLTHIGC